MGDLGVPELLIILAVVIVIFGPGKLSDLGRALGSGLKDFRRTVRDDAALEPQSTTLHTISSPSLELHDEPLSAARGADQRPD